MQIMIATHGKYHIKVVDVFNHIEASSRYFANCKTELDYYNKSVHIILATYGEHHIKVTDFYNN
jgi:hypothetical protein